MMCLGMCLWLKWVIFLCRMKFFSSVGLCGVVCREFWLLVIGMFCVVVNWGWLFFVCWWSLLFVLCVLVEVGVGLWGLLVVMRVFWVGGVVIFYIGNLGVN